MRVFPYLVYFLLVWSLPLHSACKYHQTRVAILDSGLDLSDPRFTTHLCPSGHKNFVPTEKIDDIQGHGTHIAGIIKKFANKSNYCLLIYKYYSDSANGSQNMSREVAALQEAIKNKADIVNLSGGGPEFDEDEYSIIKNNPQVTFVVAAGNKSKNLDIPGNEYYPASYWLKNEFIVGAGDYSESNYGSKVLHEPGFEVLSTLPYTVEPSGMGYVSGSSMSTARYTGKLVDKLSQMCDR